MKKYFLFLFSLLILSCSKDEESSVQESIVPVVSDIKTTEITSSSAMLKWTASISDKSKLSFKVFLEGSLVAENVTSSFLKLENLEELTKYSGKVVASSNKGKTSEKVYSFTTVQAPSPTGFEINVNEITSNSAQLTWTSSTIEGDSEISYEVYLNDDLLQENFNGTSLLLEELESFKEHAVEVVAVGSNGKKKSAQSSFKTLGVPPTSFPLSVGNSINGLEDLDPYGLQVTWTPPTVEGGYDYDYNIYLDNVLVLENLVSTADSYIFEGLNEGETYTVEIVAKALNETETIETITFTTLTHPELTDFDVEITSFDSTSASVEWTPSTYPEDKEVVYSVYLDGVQQQPSNTYILETNYLIEGLEPNTQYEVVVVAVMKEEHFTKTLEKEIVFTTDYAEHPTLQVTEAVLYTPESEFFAGQLFVKFSENIENINISKFSAGNISIDSFIFYPTSISSGIFSAEDYNTISMDKTGYVHVVDNGKIYKINFDIVEETN
ncbi:hypothetical protein GO009_00970 [Muricauda sp. TY007]|uniref:fibronectin type III domain-containing protein n=1 Tax=Allomuricauda sp. TY007 TaxID=2683200 RepID=UPI0013BF3459|nr:fibronectin type III domain-containing protein [Muricauda sp. TY007]NDV14582.1 hypothetical protein [Muricauda sp. TY007]